MNSNINNEYHKILKDIDENMSNENDIEYAKKKMYELSMMFVDELQTLSDKYEDKMNAVAIKQNEMENKIKKLENDLNNIQKEFYDEEIDENEIFEFEITCPYCNYDFTVEVDDRKKEVQCPECENLIELDWDGFEEEGYCNGSCTHHDLSCNEQEDGCCNGNCSHHRHEKYADDENQEDDDDM